MAYAGSAGVQSIQRLADVDLADMPRVPTGMSEFDRVLGGGLVPGSAVLIGGHPGAGKSTLLLQTLCELAKNQPALYVTGEEPATGGDARQTSGSADRSLAAVKVKPTSSVCSTYSTSISLRWW